MVDFADNKIGDISALYALSPIRHNLPVTNVDATEIITY